MQLRTGQRTQSRKETPRWGKGQTRYAGCVLLSTGRVSTKSAWDCLEWVQVGFFPLPAPWGSAGRSGACLLPWVYFIVIIFWGYDFLVPSHWERRWGNCLRFIFIFRVAIFLLENEALHSVKRKANYPLSSFTVKQGDLLTGIFQEFRPYHHGALLYPACPLLLTQSHAFALHSYLRLVKFMTKGP
jgi:hypothetical protein